MEPICGLGNRLQGLVSAMRLANMSKRDLRVIWGNFHPLQIKHAAGRLADLVQCEFDEVEGGWAELQFEGPVVSLCNGPKWIDWDWGALPPSPLHSGSTLRRADNSSDAVVCIVTKGPVVLEGELIDEVEPDLARLFCGLAPSAFVREAVSRFMEAQWRENMLGVHVRRGDLVDLAIRRGKRLGSMAAYCAAIDHKLASGFESIYVASDDAEAWTLLLRRYGQNRCIRYQARSLDRDNAHAVQDAFIELLLLSNTGHIVGTRYSSFSRMAAWRQLSQGGLLEDHLTVIRPSAAIQ